LLQSLGIDHTALRPHELDDAAVESSAKEREAMKIERSADDVCLAFLLERRLADEHDAAFEGEIVGLIEKGAFVRFGDEGFEGLLPSRRLRGWWTLNELGTALEHEESGRRMRLGDPIRVTVDRVEPARGRVDLSPADAYS
jgi:ribonuclease R